MQQFNITAQVYSKFDNYKQTILMNEIICALSKEDAIRIFEQMFKPDYEVLKVYSVELV